MTVPIMRKHVEWKCTLGWEKCSDCNYDRHGELFICAVCGGAEGSLPTECPGYKMSHQEQMEVYNSYKDFKGGKWVIL